MNKRDTISKYYLNSETINVLKLFIFFTIVIGYMVWGGISTYNFISDYMTVQKTPETLLNIYIYRGDKNLFIKPIILSFLFNGLLIYYLFKYVNKKEVVKYVSIFFVTSLFFILLKQTGIWQYKIIPDSFLLSGFWLYVIGNILFDSPYAMQNQAVFALWILLLYPFHKKIYSNNSKTGIKLIILILAFFINFFGIMWFFPNYFVRPIV